MVVLKLTKRQIKRKSVRRAIGLLLANGGFVRVIQVVARDIATAYRELQVRESAAPNLAGIPARQNRTAIDGLYDELNALHLAAIEHGAVLDRLTDEDREAIEDLDDEDPMWRAFDEEGDRAYEISRDCDLD